MRSRLACALLAVACMLLAAAASAEARPVLGLNDNFNAPAEVALAKSTGATTLRMFVRWDFIEGTHGRYNWRITDGQYRNALAAGMTPMWVIVGVPAWAQDPSCTRFITCPNAPASDGDYQRFVAALDRKSTRLNSSHLGISYAVFCLKKKKNKKNYTQIA